MDKYLVVYARIADDKDLGAVMTGIYIGGFCEDEAEAERIAAECATIPGAIIIPKVVRMHADNLIVLMKDIENQFQLMADRIYESEGANR